MKTPDLGSWDGPSKLETRRMVPWRATFYSVAQAIQQAEQTAFNTHFFDRFICAAFRRIEP
jgi:hypothetical protein